jgi:hypothetical protein
MELQTKKLSLSKIIKLKQQFVEEAKNLGVKVIQNPTKENIENLTKTNSNLKTTTVLLLQENVTNDINTLIKERELLTCESHVFVRALDSYKKENFSLFKRIKQFVYYRVFRKDWEWDDTTKILQDLIDEHRLSITKISNKLSQTNKKQIDIQLWC